MTQEQLARWALEKMEQYCRETTPQQRFERLVARGVIDKDGKVLLCGDDDDSEVCNGQAKAEEKKGEP